MSKEIPLNRGKYALVDDADFDWLNQWRWNIHSNGCAKRNISKTVNGKRKFKTIRMHRLIMNPPEGFEVDHINGDPLDNRRENLRVCKHSENCRNTKWQKGKSQFKGVYKYKNKWGEWWAARIRIHPHRYVIGYFHEEMEAAFAYDLAALSLHGEYARLNFGVQD